MFFELASHSTACTADCHRYRIQAAVIKHSWCTQAAAQRHKHPTKTNLPSAQEAEAMLYLDRDMFTPQVRLGRDLKVLFLACPPTGGCCRLRTG